MRLFSRKKAGEKPFVFSQDAATGELFLVGLGFCRRETFFLFYRSVCFGMKAGFTVICRTYLHSRFFKKNRLEWIALYLSSLPL